MIIYFTFCAAFGLVAAVAQYRKFRPLFVELMVTFLVNLIFAPVIIGFSIAKVLKSDKVVIIPKL